MMPMRGSVFDKPGAEMKRTHYFERRIAANIAKLPELLRRSARAAQLLLDVGHHRARQARLAEFRKVLSNHLLP
jgi:hypothetical protein